MAARFPDFESRSAALFERAKQVFPGGSTRNQTYFPPHMVYAASAQGCRMRDADGNELIDFHNDYTVTILGHGHPQVVKAVADQAQRIMCSALAVEAEIELAETICARNPGFERMRFVVTGSEAVMNAMKAARAYTGRPKIAKCEGCYHGSNDFAEVSLDPTPQNWGERAPKSVGFSAHVPQGVMDNMVVIPFNDVEAAQAILDAHAHELAGILVDLAPTRCGARLASPQFIAMLERFTKATGALLIVDEVVSFRMRRGGVQEMLGCRPDITTLGKIIGGGMPIGGLAGRADVMEAFNATQGKPLVPQSGTFTAHPLSMVAGIATLQVYDGEAIERLNGLGEVARTALREAMALAGVEGQVTGESSLFEMTFSTEPLTDYRSVWRATSEQHRRIMAALFPKLIDRGILISAWGLGCLSTPMGQAEIDLLAQAVLEGLREVKQELAAAA
jgi:glutamate-1-semialdehyde 2,1-aminomutase